MSKAIYILRRYFTERAIAFTIAEVLVQTSLDVQHGFFTLSFLVIFGSKTMTSRNKHLLSGAVSLHMTQRWPRGNQITIDKIQILDLRNEILNMLKF